MPPQARKEVELRLNVVVDPSRASAAMRALNDLKDKLERNGSQAARTLGGGGSFSQAAGEVLGSGAGRFAVAGAAVATVARFAENLPRLASTSEDLRSKFTGLVATVPVFGKAVASLTDSVLNAAEFFRDPEKYIATSERLAALPGRLLNTALFGDRQLATAGRNRELFGAEAQQDAVRRFPSVAGRLQREYDAGGGGGFFSRLALTNFTELMDPREREAEEGVNLARRGRFAALREDIRIRDQLDVQEQTYENARRDAANRSRARIALEERAQGAQLGYAPGVVGNLQKLPGNIERWWTGASMNQELKGAAAAELEAIAVAEKELKKLEELRLAARQKGLMSAQASYELAKRENDLLKTKAGILQEQEQKARDKTTAFGAMDEVQRRGLLYALQDFQRGGERAINADQRSLLLSNPITAETVGRGLAKNVENDPTLKELFRLTQQRDADDLRRERRAVEAKVNVGVDFADQALANLRENVFKAMTEWFNKSDEAKALFRQRSQEAQNRLSGQIGAAQN